ncbi:hypothetical protein TNCV_559001 [Trichonephila clavipes]|nr:hypothetical protein TNCV_559001 [Trichonephila clavipes]
MLALRTPVSRAHWDVDFFGDRVNESSIPIEAALLDDECDRSNSPLCLSIIAPSVSNVSRKRAMLKRVGGSIPYCCLQCDCTSLIF